MSTLFRRALAAAALTLVVFSMPALAQATSSAGTNAPGGNGMTLDPNGGQHAAAASASPTGSGMTIDPNG